MTYEELRNNYKWSLKHFPDISSLFSVDKITLIETREKRAKSGWKKTEEEEKNITFECYLNIVDSIPFFRNLGGSETVTKSYTKYGLIPVKIISTSPCKNDRTIRTFKF